MTKTILICALGALLTACASTVTDSNDQPEERTYKTGSMIPQREAGIKTLDKDQIRNTASPYPKPEGATARGN